MKQLGLFLGLAIAVGSAPAFAQEVEIDTFDSYADTAGMNLVWSQTAGFPARALGAGGAEGSASYLDLEDGGFSMSVTGSNFVNSPTAGNYTLDFFYRNGIDGGEAMSALKVDLVQDSAIKLSVELGDAAAADWTAASSAPTMLTASPVTLVITAANGAAATHTADFDQFVLTPVASVPLNLTVWPDDRIYLSGSETIVATPTFGSESYTKVDFDVNDDGTIEHTDTESPFEFPWNTLNDVAAGTSRTLSTTTPLNTPIAVSITVTDSENNTKEIIEEYTVDNEYDGRESMIVNSDFSQWQGTGFGSNLPVGWVENWTSFTLPQYGIGEGRSVEAGNALQITLTNATSELEPFPDRYVLRTESKVGVYRDQQVTMWGKGTYARLYYMTSEDGVTFTTTLVLAAQADGNNWNFAVGVPRTPAALGLTDTTHTALGTHQLGTTDHFWDDVTWEGNLLPETSNVEGWNLY